MTIPSIAAELAVSRVRDPQPASDHREEARLDETASIRLSHRGAFNLLRAEIPSLDPAEKDTRTCKQTCRPLIAHNDERST
jgi:hypothetical protein